MKRFLSIFLVCVVFVFCCFLSGCESDQIKISGKIVGLKVVQQNPDLAKESLTYAKGLLETAKEGKIDSATFLAAVELLKTKMNLKTGAAEDLLIVTAIAMIDTEIKTGTVNANLVSLLSGFVEGIGG